MIVEIPDDIYAYESKAIGNLTKRQALCFAGGGGVVLGVFIPLFQVTQSSTLAALVSFSIAIPLFFLCAVVRRDGQPLEKVLKYRMRWKKRPHKRPYHVSNFYEEINQLDKEAWSDDIQNKKEKFIIRKKTQHTDR